RRERGHRGCRADCRSGANRLRPADHLRRGHEETAACRSRQGLPRATDRLRLEAAGAERMIGLGTSDAFSTFVGTVAFWVGAIASIMAGYMMVARIKNLIRSALALTTVLGGVAMMYALLGADFLAVAQLVVYVGAIMVLIIFAIFMTPGQIDIPGLVGQGQRIGALLVAIGI